MNELERNINFLIETDKLKSIYRRARIKSDKNRRENSAEHSWHVSLMGFTLVDYCSEKIDVLKVLKMLIIHDIVEIYAGDTFAFDEENIIKEQGKKEYEAAEKIFSLLPNKQYTEMKDLWIEFEENKTNEAKFSKAIERSIPVLQNMQNNGGSWIAHGSVSKEQVLQRNKELKYIAPKLWDYISAQIEMAKEKGWLV